MREDLGQLTHDRPVHLPSEGVAIGLLEVLMPRRGAVTYHSEDLPGLLGRSQGLFIDVDIQPPLGEEGPSALHVLHLASLVEEELLDGGHGHAAIECPAEDERDAAWITLTRQESCRREHVLAHVERGAGDAAPRRRHGRAHGVHPLEELVGSRRDGPQYIDEVEARLHPLQHVREPPVGPEVSGGYGVCARYSVCIHEELEGARVLLVQERHETFLDKNVTLLDHLRTDAINVIAVAVVVALALARAAVALVLVHRRLAVGVRRALVGGRPLPLAALPIARQPTQTFRRGGPGGRGLEEVLGGIVLGYERGHDAPGCCNQDQGQYEQPGMPTHDYLLPAVASDAVAMRYECAFARGPAWLGLCVVSGRAIPSDLVGVVVEASTERRRGLTTAEERTGCAPAVGRLLLPPLHGAEMGAPAPGLQRPHWAIGRGPGA